MHFLGLVTHNIATYLDTLNPKGNDCSKDNDVQPDYKSDGADQSEPDTDRSEPDYDDDDQLKFEGPKYSVQAIPDSTGDQLNDGNNQYMDDDGADTENGQLPIHTYIHIIANIQDVHN